MAIDLAKLGDAAPPVPQSKAPQGVVSSNVKSKRWNPELSFGNLRSPRVALDDVAIFTQQLGLLLETGNGLAPSIGALATQTGSPAMKSVLTDVHKKLEEGNPLSECLKQHPKAFDNLFLSLVRAGEASGSLAEALERIGGIIGIRLRLLARVREAMTYPVILLCIMFVTIVFLFTFLVPRFESIFDLLGDELPLSTRFLLGVSDVMRTKIWAVGIGVVALVLGVRWMWKVAAIRNLVDRLKEMLPGVGPLVRDMNLFQLFSTFGLLLHCRVPHLEAISIVRHVVKSPRYVAFFDDLTGQIEAGRGVAAAFQQATIFPDVVKLMVTTGESSGALDSVMARLGERYRSDLEDSIQKFSSLIEPLMLVVMGIVVGFIAVSFIVPIMKMSRAVH